MGQRLIYVTCIKYFGRKTSSCFTCDCEIYQENILGLDFLLNIIQESDNISDSILMKILLNNDDVIVTMMILLDKTLVSLLIQITKKTLIH